MTGWKRFRILLTLAFLAPYGVVVKPMMFAAGHYPEVYADQGWEPNHANPLKRAAYANGGTDGRFNYYSMPWVPVYPFFWGRVNF